MESQVPIPQLFLLTTLNLTAGRVTRQISSTLPEVMQLVFLSMAQGLLLQEETAALGLTISGVSILMKNTTNIDEDLISGFSIDVMVASGGIKPKLFGICI